MLSQAYIFEKYGGLPDEIRVHSANGDLWIDNVDGNGHLHEAKTSIVDEGAQNVNQLRDYASLLEEAPGVVLFYDFFANPGHDGFGPTEQFANRLAAECRSHNISVNIHPPGWWDEMQREPVRLKPPARGAIERSNLSESVRAEG